jgi:hypothetical protein
VTVQRLVKPRAKLRQPVLLGLRLAMRPWLGPWLAWPLLLPLVRMSALAAPRANTR